MTYPYSAAPGGYGPVPTAPAHAYPMPAPYQPVYRPMRQTHVGKIIFWVIAGVIFLIFGMAAIWLTGHGSDLVGVILGILLSVLPVPVIVLAAVWLSWSAPQPWGARIFALCWGAAVATLFAAVTNTFTGGLIVSLTDKDSGNILTAVLVAPPVEETCKGLALLAIFLFSRFRNNGRYFTGPIDGITYALFVGAGFAFTENIAYLARSYTQGLDVSNGMAEAGIILLVFTFVVRCIGTPFGHPLFTSATGIGMGVAARSNNHIAIRIMAPLIGWLVAMLLHGTFNLVASFLPPWVAQQLGTANPLLTVIAANGSFIVALFPLFVIGVGVAIYVRQSQFRVVRRGLPQYAAAGWIDQTEVDWLSSLRGRSQARRWAKQVAGSPGLAAMKEYQFAATRLAILRDGANNGQVGSTFTQSEQGLLSALGQQRKFFSPHSATGPMPGGSAPGFQPAPGPYPPYGQQLPAPGHPSGPPAYSQPSGPPAYNQPSRPPAYEQQPPANPNARPSDTQHWQRP
jgi:RsiW-degrading membrane proteinase PrsW (M82 family)